MREDANPTHALLSKDGKNIACPVWRDEYQKRDVKLDRTRAANKPAAAN